MNTTDIIGKSKEEIYKCIITGLPLSELNEKYYNLLGIESMRLRTKLEDAIENAIEAGYTHFISGVECGSDTFAQWSVEDIMWTDGAIKFERTFNLIDKIDDAQMLICIYDGQKPSSMDDIIARSKSQELEIIVILPESFNI